MSSTLTITNKLQELYAKPASYKFNSKELNFIKKHLKRSDYRILYAFYKKKSASGSYIEFIIDSMFHSPRRSAAMNNWQVICNRPISNLEFEELCQNFGTNLRRFEVYHYNTIDYLIYEDKKYGIETPEQFVTECRKRGYSGEYQLEIQF